MKILLVNQSRDHVSDKWLAKWVKGLSMRLIRRGYKQVKGRELVLVFVNSGEIRRMNTLYRRKDYSTDILSFEPADETSLGELVMCLPIIRSQAKRTGLSDRGELGYMIVHGVLHLLGHDHMKKEEELEMFALQDALYSDLEKKVGLK